MPFQLTYKNIKFSGQNWSKNTPVFLSDSSGKEKDSETGYHYFGARYYNSDLSLWLSVDLMSDKYPSLSPYNYCAWNPLRIVDPDGSEAEENIDWVKKTGTNQYIWLDIVDSKDNTPQGYDYVGPDDNDILRDMGIPENFSPQEMSRNGCTSRWRPGAFLGIIFGDRRCESTARLSVSANHIDCSEYITEANKKGRVFAGLTFTASVSQTSASIDMGWDGMTYSGGLSRSFLDKKGTIYDCLTKPTTAQLNAEHYSTATATCTVSAQQIIKRGIPTTARVTLGYCNPSSYNLPMNFKWRIRTN